jgi:hypothetical protein
MEGRMTWSSGGMSWKIPSEYEAIIAERGGEAIAPSLSSSDFEPNPVPQQPQRVWRQLDQETVQKIDAYRAQLASNITLVTQAMAEGTETLPSIHQVTKDYGVTLEAIIESTRQTLEQARLLKADLEERRSANT